MKYKIILCEGEGTKINWQLMHDYSILVNIPLGFLSNQYENLELYSDLVRREGAAIHSFLVSLNTAVRKSDKLKRVSVNYSDKCKHQNIEILDETDLTLERGKEYVLQANSPKYKRGLIVRLLEDGGYDVIIAACEALGKNVDKQ